jgi:hypothetical protein
VPAVADVLLVMAELGVDQRTAVLALGGRPWPWPWPAAGPNPPPPRTTLDSASAAAYDLEQLAAHEQGAVMNNVDNKVWENRLRRQAVRLGLALRKSRARRLHLNDRGKYRIVNEYRNTIIAGERFDLELADVEAILDRIENEMPQGRIKGPAAR